MENTTYYDLTPGQRLLLYSQSFTIHKQINNIFTLMLLEKKLNLDTLKSAVEYAYEQNDAFRLRITKKDRKIKQYFAQSEKPSVKILDFAGKTKKIMEKRLYRYARTPIKIIDTPMTRVFLIRAWNGMEGIYLGVCHMILDSWGICVFLQYVMEVYEAMINGTPMPKTLSPLKPLLERDLAYIDSPQHEKDKEFWQNEFSRRGEPLISHMNGPSVLEKYRKKKKDPSLRYAKTILLRSSARHEVLYVSKEDVEKIQAYCEQQHISMQSVFMFGLRSALSKLNNRQTDIEFSSTYARRGTLQEKRSGGSRVHSAPFRTIMDEDKTFEQACQEIYSHQMLTYRHADSDTVEILEMEKKAYGRKGYLTGWAPTVFTFQPIRLVVKDGTPLHTKWYCNGAFSTAHYLTIMDADGTGALRCYHEYQKHAIKATRIREFQSLMVQAIMTGVSSSTITIGGILDTIDQNVSFNNVTYLESPKDVQIFGAEQKVAEK